GPGVGPGLPVEYFGAFGVDQVIEEPLSVKVVVHPLPPVIPMTGWDWADAAAVQTALLKMDGQGTRFTLYETMPLDGGNYVAHLEDEPASLSVDAAPFVGLDDEKLLE